MTVPYSELFAGSDEISSTLACFVAGGVIPALTPLMQDATSGLIVPWDGMNSGQAVYLSAFEINTDVQRRAKVYKGGIFNIDVVAWPDSVTTTEKKMAAFVGSPISVQPLEG